MQITTDIEREKPEQNNKITNPIPNVIPALYFFFTDTRMILVI